MHIKHKIPMTSTNPLSLPIHNKNSNNQQQQRIPIYLSPFILALFLSLSFLLFLSLQIPHHSRISPPITPINFSLIFLHLRSLNLLHNTSQTLIISSHSTQDIIHALLQIGVTGPITETNPNQLYFFQDKSFEFVFSAVFDEAKDGAEFAQQVERVMKQNGACALLVGSQMEKVVALFELSEVVEVKQVNGFGSLHTEIILRKTKNLKMG